ncbi:hypothetical protein SAMN05443429_101467 [Cruoricaptor ignavus]|uniref:Uncharacterized protein n=1 Tax=Cruoricaptor ignavus TaxID=1118202 RepID=A0A1M6AZ07_9FLAO|nr:hypothetical protein SAMN05443429_101467 [Cruoricaptor ignavus]
MIVKYIYNKFSNHAHMRKYMRQRQYPLMVQDHPTMKLKILDLHN